MIDALNLAIVQEQRARNDIEEYNRQIERAKRLKKEKFDRERFKSE
jgi:hypothetical protein